MCKSELSEVGIFLDVGVYLECLGPVCQEVGNKRWEVSGMMLPDTSCCHYLLL